MTPNEGDPKAPKIDRPPAKLHVRLADSIADLEFTRIASIELHQESRFSNINYSHKKRDDLFVRAINKPDRYALLVAEYKAEPVGFLFCTIGEYIVGYGDLMTTVYSFYVRKKFRDNAIGGKAAMRMLQGIVHWSKVRRAKDIMIHVTSGIDIQRTDKLLQRRGFRVIGANYSLL